jgi:hypothetical protein
MCAFRTRSTSAVITCRGGRRQGSSVRMRAPRGSTPGQVSGRWLSGRLRAGRGSTCGSVGLRCGGTALDVANRSWSIAELIDAADVADDERRPFASLPPTLPAPPFPVPTPKLARVRPRFTVIQSGRLD